MLSAIIKNKITIVIFVVIATALTGYIIYNNMHKNDEYVARVNGVGISKQRYNQEITSLKTFYTASNQSINEEMLSTTVLENLINQTLVESYAAENNITALQDKIDEAYKSRVSTYKDEQEFLTAIDKLYGTTKEEFLLTLSYDILRDSVQFAVNEPLNDWLNKQKETAKIEIYINK